MEINSLAAASLLDAPKLPSKMGDSLHPMDPQAIDKVSRQFESLFTSMLLKEMRQTLEPDGMFGKNGGDVYGGLFDMFLGQHLAESGGLGIATMVKRQLELKAKHGHLEQNQPVAR